MRRRFKIAFAILLVATIVWTLACYLHVQAYNQMIEKKRQQVGDEIIKIIDFYPVWIWGLGELLLGIGFGLGISWILVAYSFVSKHKKRLVLSKRQTVGAYVICAIVFILGLPLIKISPLLFLIHSMSSMFLTLMITCDILRKRKKMVLSEVRGSP